MIAFPKNSVHPLPILLVASSDHLTPITGAALSVTLSKDGAAFGAPVGTVAEIGSGWYKLTPTSADTDTLGTLLLHATATGADPSDTMFQITGANLDDAVRLGISALPNVAAEAAGGLITRGTGAGQIVLTSGKVDVNDKTAFALTSPYDPAKTAAQVGSAMTLTSAYDAAKTAAPAGAAMTLTSAERNNTAVAVRDVDNAPSVPGSLGGDIKSGITGDLWNTVLPGSYAAGTAGKLVGDNIDAKVSTRMTQASYVAPPSAGTIATSVRDVNNDSPAPGSMGEDIANAASAGDPWGTLLPGSYGAGTAGKLMSDNLNATVSSRAATGAAMTLTTGERDATAAAVRDVSNATPAAGSLGEDVKSGATAGDPWVIPLPGAYAAGTAGQILGDRLDVDVSSRLADSVYVAPPSVTQIAEATRDVSNASPAAGSMGEAINSAASAGDPWSTTLPGSYADGTAGKIIGANIDATTSSRLAAINYIAPPTKEIIAVAVRDVDNSSPVSGSLGDKVNAGASAGDPWSTVLPGSYGAGSAGKLMSDNLDAKVSTRMTQASYTTAPTTAEVATAVRDVNNLTPAPNSLGAAVNSAASAGDPWSTVLPGSYGSNTAGQIIGTQLDAAMSSRLAANNYVTPPSIEAIAVASRDVNNQSPATNSLGAAVNSAASAGDPWSAQLPNPAYGAGTAGKLISDQLNAPVASRLAATDYVIPPNTSQIAAATRDVDNTNPVPGSMGDKINNAASAGDPWGTVLPGAYPAGTAGSMIGNNMDAKVSTRLPTSSYTAAPGVQQIAEGVRDIDNTAPAANSLGADVKLSAATGDPWSITVPGSYPAGSAGKIIGDNLDAKVSTRSTYAGADTPGTTTLLTRVPSAIAVTGGKVDVADKTNFSLTPDYDKAKTAAQPGDQMALTSGERTTLASVVWQQLTSFMTTVGSIGKLLIDTLNAPVASRLASSAYVPPDNAGIAAIKAKTDTIPPNPALSTDVPTPAVIAAAVRDVDNATPAVGSMGAEIKAGAQVTPDPWLTNVPGTYPAGTAGNVLGVRLDASVSTRLPTANILLTSGMVTVGTNNDKTGYALTSDQASTIADTVLKRDWQQITGEATFSVLNALRFIRNAWEVRPDGTLIVYKENGQVSWSRSVRADPNAQPIIGVQ